MASDPLSDFLVNEKSRRASLSPESLEMMGKQAANMYLNEGLSLNEGVAKLAGAHQDINQEQIKRVCEFANTAVYLAKHDQSKTAGASSSYPQYELADPARVIQDLADGARPTVVTSADLDYSRQPQKAKTASARAEKALADLFTTTGETDKVASAHYTQDTAVSDMIATKDMLTGMRDHLRHSAEQFDLLHKEASENYYESVKRHLLDGHDFADVMICARSTGLEDAKIAAVLSPAVERILLEKVSSPQKMQKMARNLEKVAHRVVNPKHPFVSLVSDISILEDEIDKCASALTDVSEQLSEVTTFIRSQFGARRSSR